MRGDPPVRLGVSACLLGERVRWDGGHKRDRFLTSALARHVTWVPVCPEMAIGLGVPRETVRLERSGRGVRMVAPASGKDHTVAMRRWARAHLEELAQARLHGFVLKKGSPSCGLFGVKVRGADGRTRRDGRGLFARELTARFAALPVEDEGRLADERVRDAFLERVFAYARWTRLLESGVTADSLAGFHAVHEMQLRSHSRSRSDRLMDLVLRMPSRAVVDRYGALFLETLALPVPRRRRVAAMGQLVWSVFNRLTRRQVVRFVKVVADYRAGRVSRAALLAHVRQLLRRHRAPAWALSQTYLEPYPDALLPR